MGIAGRFGAIITTPTDLAEQTAVLAAAAAAGGSFQRGLMPRSTTDQAAITGLLVAFNYGRRRHRAVGRAGARGRPGRT